MQPFISHASRVATQVTHFITQMFARFKSLPRTYRYGIIAAFVLVGGGTITLLSSHKEVAPVTKKVPAVSLFTAGDSQDISSVPFIGTVNSVQEATIRTEASGQLTHVYVKLGDKVTAGQTLATFENSSEQAALTQAEGAYDQAKAARNIFLASKEISGLQNGSSNTTLLETKRTIVNTLIQTQTTVDDIIHVKTDITFNEPRKDNPTILLTVPDQVLVSRIENTRVTLEAMLSGREKKNSQLTADTLTTITIDENIAELSLYKRYLDDLSKMYTVALPNNSFSQVSIDQARTSVNQARATISGAISSLTSSKLTLAQAGTAKDISSTSYGNKDIEITANDAAVKIALGGYNAALARLNKTIIRSSISGTLNSWNLKTGDYVGNGQQVAVVSNNGSLEIVSNVSSDDASKFHVGDEVKIDNKVSGVVTRVAEGIDPITNKIEIHVGITDRNTSLINGQTVSLSLHNITTKVVPTKTVPAIISLPLSAIKITSEGAFVFTVSSSTEIIVAKPVILGALRGEYVEISSGVTSGDVLIKDVRGRKAGDAVQVTK